MREIGAFEAKNRLGALLAAAESGEEVVITRHGKAIAKLVPATAGFDPVRARQAMRGLRLKGVPIKSLVEEGRP